MSVRLMVTGMACLALVGCPKNENKEATPDPSAIPDANAPSDARANVDAGAVVPPTVTSPPTKGASFSGKYVVSAGTMYVPAEKDWASVKFKNDDSKLLGDGVMNLVIDAAGRVTGGAEGGPLGASVIEGTSDGTTLTAAVRRKDPTDDGLTGTLTATIAGDKLDGTMKLAEFNAAVVRVATLSATKK